jgi:hypothetical protein
MGVSCLHPVLALLVEEERLLAERLLERDGWGLVGEEEVEGAVVVVVELDGLEGVVVGEVQLLRPAGPRQSHPQRPEHQR